MKQDPSHLEHHDASGNLRDQLLAQRYLAKDRFGHVIETPDQMFRRVAQCIAQIERKYHTAEEDIRRFEDQAYRLMAEGKFSPNSPTYMNAGQTEGFLNACSVLPIGDSVDEIFTTLKNAAIIQKHGAGTGFDLDALRPTGDIIRTSGGTTTGPVSFLKVFNEMGNAISQGGRRRSANIPTMSVTHPDILSFLHAKDDPAALANFNLSVKITDAFMDQLIHTPDVPHQVINPRTGKAYMIPATVKPGAYTLSGLVEAIEGTANCLTIGQIWDRIVQRAHATGEPGIILIDRINQANPTPHLGPIHAVNPCGEQPLLDHESCNLGSINVSAYLDTDKTVVCWEALKQDVATAVRFLDNVIDANCWPLDQMKAISLASRKIGLGVMGLWDALVLLGIAYDSEQAVQFADRLMAFIRRHAHQASQQLAQERAAFPNWKGSRWDTEQHTPMRNATLTTIAPTGSISILFNCSSGIEPPYSLAYRRRALDAREYVQIHPLVQRIGTQQGWLTPSVLDRLLAGSSARLIAEIPAPVAGTLVTSLEIEPAWHVRIQAAFQKHVDNAVSKTVNLPESATIEAVDKIFRLAFTLGCKGITVYRNQSRPHQVFSQVNAAQKVSVEPMRPRPRVTVGTTSKYRMGCGTLYVTVNKDPAGLAEVFANLGKGGGCPAQTEATCRVVSAALRSGVPPAVLVKQLRGIRCVSAAAARRNSRDIDVVSCPDAIARALEQAMGPVVPAFSQSTARRCPDCGHILLLEAGCEVCQVCGYSHCG